MKDPPSFNRAPNGKAYIHSWPVPKLITLSSISFLLNLVAISYNHATVIVLNHSLNFRTIFNRS